MSRDALIITLDGPEGGEDDALARDFARVLDRVYEAMDIIIAYRSGAWPRLDVRPYWSQTLSRLQFLHTRPGSLAAALTGGVSPGSFREGAESPSETWRLERHYGEQALAALSGWDGIEGSTLPPAVTDCLYDAASHLSKGTELWLGDNSMPHRIRVMPRSDPQVSELVEARLQGWLKAVNWDQRTARLYDAAGGYVRLRFREQHDEDMRRLATQYVEVEGQGEINRQDKWAVVRVEELRETPSWSEPFDLDAFLNTPNLKRFVPAEMVTASEPFDAEEFNRATREARDR